jgi:hypothetical protein
MRSRLPFLAVAALAVFASAVPASEEKTNIPGPGTDVVGIMKSDETTLGSFDGTWMYVNRDAHFAMWIRTKDGKRQVRLQYQSLAGPESFETDWDGKAVYYMAGQPVTFELKLDDPGPNRMTGTWNWVAKLEHSGRKETADILMYRTAYGRSLNMDFKNYAKTLTREGKDRTVRVPTSWNWLKISKREILWEELPF